MRIDTAPFTAKNTARVKRPRFVVEMAFDNANSTLRYFTSHTDSALPPGATAVLGVVQGLSGTSQTLNPDKAQATIGNIDYRLVDKGGQVTAVLGGQLALGRSTRKQRTRVYMGFEGLAWSDYVLLPMTQFVTEIAFDKGSYAVSCNDIQRQLRFDVFVQNKTPLASAVGATELTAPCSAAASTITVADTSSFPTSGSGIVRDTVSNDLDLFTWTGKTATTLTGCSGLLAHAIGAMICDSIINVVDTSHFSLVPHGTSYSDAPSATVGYIKIGDTVYRYTGKTATTFTGCVPGVLNTLAAPQSVDTSQPSDRRTQVTEHIYFELPVLKAMYALLTGKDHTGTTIFPSNWNLGISTTYVRLSDFTSMPDLWNTADDQQGLVVRFEDRKRIDGKQFIETQVALLGGVFMPVYADGALGCKRMANILAGAAYVALLDARNVTRWGELVHDFNSLHNVFQVDWNWETGQGNGEGAYTRTNLLIDSNSVVIHQPGEPFKFQFAGLHGSRHSSATVARLFDALRDRYTGPPIRRMVNVLPSLNTLEVGDVVRVTDPRARDFVANSTLDRSFEIQGVSVDWRTGDLQLKLFASSQAPGALAATSDTIVLSDAWYASQGTPLSSVLTITGSNPGHVTANGSLTGNADLTNTAAIYYYNGDLQIDSGVSISIGSNVWLRIKGNLQNNGTINGVGGGLAGAVAPNPALATDVTLGTVGFLGSTESGGGEYVKGFDLYSLRGGQVVGRNTNVPAFNISWDGTTLLGVPPDLRGSSGSSGLPSGVVRTTSNTELFASKKGGDGGAGGAGLCITCRGFSQGASGVVNLSGADGLAGSKMVVVAPSFSDRSQDDSAWSGSGGGGAPGGLLILLDGALQTATGLTESGFVALQGKTPITGIPAPGPLINLTTNGNQIFLYFGHEFYSYYVGTGDGTTFPLPSLSGARGGSRVQFVPGTVAAVQDPIAEILTPPSNLGLASGTSELLKQGDGTIVVRIKVTWTPSTDSRVAGYDLQFKQSSDAAWQDAPPALGPNANLAWIIGVKDGVNYDVRVRAAGHVREVSTWLTISGFLVVGKTAKPVDVGTITYTEPIISWLPNTTDDDLAGYIVRYQPSWASTDWVSSTPAHDQGFITETQFDTVKLVGGQVTMLVKCVDTSGNESVNVSSKQIDLRPPVPTGFTVTRQPDGTRQLAWILASPPSDLDGFRIKWFLGSTSDWTAMTLLHTGLLKASPFESNQLAAGTYTFAIKSVDKAGNESATALFIDSLTIGDPRIAGSIDDFLEEPFWTETKTNAILDGATGWLVASGSGSWNTIPTTWDAWNSWIVSPAGSIQYERKIDVGLITTFTPLVTVVADSTGGSVVIEEAHSNTDSGYSAFAAVGPELLTRWIKIRVTVTGTFPKIKSERIILSATPIEEEITDLSTSTLTGAYRIGTGDGDIRLPITKAYNIIKKVDVTLQSVGAGWSVELIDKDKTVGPRIKIYNSSNTLADALIDATVKGI